MAKLHKYSNSTVEFITALRSEDVLNLAGRAVETQPDLRLLGRAGGVLSGMVDSWAGLRPLTFTLTVKPTFGRTHAKTSIVDYDTARTLLFDAIPVGPKTMLGYSQYKRFLELMRRVIMATDPSAIVALRERGVA